MVVCTAANTSCCSTPTAAPKLPCAAGVRTLRTPAPSNLSLQHTDCSTLFYPRLHVCVPCARPPRRTSRRSTLTAAIYLTLCCRCAYHAHARPVEPLAAAHRLQHPTLLHVCVPCARPPRRTSRRSDCGTLSYPPLHFTRFWLPAARVILRDRRCSCRVARGHMQPQGRRNLCAPLQGYFGKQPRAFTSAGHSHITQLRCGHVGLNAYLARTSRRLTALLRVSSTGDPSPHVHLPTVHRSPACPAMRNRRPAHFPEHVGRPGWRASKSWPTSPTQVASAHMFQLPAKCLCFFSLLLHRPRSPLSPVFLFLTISIRPAT